MRYEPVGRERKAIYKLFKMIGAAKIPSITKKAHFSTQNLHIYSQKLKTEKQIFVSIWTEPKEKKSSKCIFADKISLNALNFLKTEYLPYVRQ